MSLPLKPIFLLSDSQLLFWKNRGTLFLQSVKELLTTTSPKAAYLGASNGDDPQFYSIFEAAMQAVDVRDCRMILSSFSADDESFVKQADIILLAGGDVERGWNVFNEVGLKELVTKRYYEGSLLIGVSAGAVQLGLYALVEAEGSFNKLIDTFKLVPFLIGAHEERQEWRSIREAIQLLDGKAEGIGIPGGGGLVYYPDQSIEAIRHPAHEFSVRDGVISHSLLAPNQEQ
jgi:cyanophycinase